MPKSVTIERLAEWLAAQDDVLVLGHVSPDGDALGSTLAIVHALRALGKRAWACLPGGAPGTFGILPGMDEVLDASVPLPFAPKAALSVDVSEPARLGDGLELFEACERRAMLDHHATNPGFGELYVVDAEAAAAGEIALSLIDALGVALTPAMAECLFVAISTDTGNFNFDNTRGATLRAAARCVDAGADVSALTRRLYRTRTLGRTRLTGLVLSELEISSDGRIAWSRLTEDMLVRAGAKREDNEAIVNYLVEIAGVRAAILAEQRGDQTKLSLRSVPPFNIARAVAVPLGGGGHACAAGATLPLSVDAALEKAVALVRAALEEEDAAEASR